MIQPNKSPIRSLAVAALSLALAVPALAGTAFADASPVDQASAAAAAEGADGRSGRNGSPVTVVSEVARYVVGPLGHVRGFLLKDGTAVMVHGAAGDAMAKDIPVGQSVRVEGWSPASSGGKAVMHASVFGPRGQVVTPPARGAAPYDPTARRAEWGERREEIARLPDASANGTVQTVIVGHRGKPVAVVLADGTSVFLRHGLAKEVMARGIRVGDQIQSSGKGATYPLGASVVVSSITFADGTHFEAPARGDGPRT